MHPCGLAALLAVAAPLRAPAAQRVQGEEPALELRVNRAIARGVEFLRGAQGGDGLWTYDQERRYPGGLTALVSYTLVKSGLPRDDAGLGKALRVLGSLQDESTYGNAARLLLYEALDEGTTWHERAGAARDALLASQTGELWSYVPGDPRGDLSNTQFALLGLRAAERMGLEVPTDALERCARGLFALHADDAGFRYQGDAAPTGGITAASLAGLAILDEHASGRSGLGGLLAKHAQERRVAHEWLVERWDPERNPHGRASYTPAAHYCYLWAVERYADLTGRERLGEHAWYEEGAEYLVADQRRDGSWGEGGPRTWIVPDTCFALLFLRRAIFSGGPELAEIYASIDRLAALRGRERAPEPPPGLPYLVDWLLAGPWPGTRGETRLFDPPFDPRRISVNPRGKVDTQRWERVTLLADTWSDLELVSGGTRRHDCLWVLGTRIERGAPGDPPGDGGPLDAALWLEVDDSWRVFWDGEEIARDNLRGLGLRAYARVPLVITGGVHELVVLLDEFDRPLPSAFGAQLGGPDGRPLAEPLMLGFGK